jgi:putative acetyltransferase
VQNYSSILKLSQKDYPHLIEIWEASVRTTHHFLPPDFIPTYKPLILNNYFDAVDLFGVKNEEGEITAFSGILDSKLEMLFVHPDHFRKCFGKILLDYAINSLSVCKVDVNEQNEQAVAFYLSQGFRIDFRSEFDGQGNPFPILHLKIRV